jgi:hypothetical protein
LTLNLGALRNTPLRTDVDWDNFEWGGFFQTEGFAPAKRLCLECRLDPTSQLI